MKELTVESDWTLSPPMAGSYRCMVCGETKPLTKEFWFPKLNRNKRAWNYQACRECLNVMRRDSCRDYAKHRRATDEGRAAIRKSVKNWKARNQDKVLEQNRRRRVRIADQNGKEYIPMSVRQELAYPAQRIRNAKIAFRRFIDESSDEEVKCWYEATGKPWLNPRLTSSDKWVIKYQTDINFNAREKARCYAKKMRRKHGIAITDDGTVPDKILIDARSCLYCGAKFDDNCKPTLDHLIPLTKGGTHSAANIIVCCLSCNSRKGARDFLEFAQSLPDPYRARSLRTWRKLRGAAPQQQVLIG